MLLGFQAIEMTPADPACCRTVIPCCIVEALHTYIRRRRWQAHMNIPGFEVLYR